MLDASDFVFLNVYLLGDMRKSLTNINLGIWNFKQNSERISSLLSGLYKVRIQTRIELKLNIGFQVESLILFMSGRIDDRTLRRVPRGKLLSLTEKVSTSAVESGSGGRNSLKVLYLPEVNIDTPGLMVEVIDSLLTRCKSLTTLLIPAKVTRTLSSGTEVPFIGNLHRLGPNHRFVCLT